VTTRHRIARGRLVELLIGATILASALPAIAGRPATAEARPLFTGISGIAEYEPLAFQRAKDAGADYVRLSVDWSEVAPSRPPAAWQPDSPVDPHYDWRHTDEGVIMATQAGLAPVLMIEEAPSWAQGCRTTLGGNCDDDPAALAAFATAAARRYSGAYPDLPRVWYWQALNEPNLSLYFNPQFEAGQPVSADRYRVLLEAFYAAVKSVDPSNLVVAAGLGPIAVPKYTIGPIRFLRELLCMRGRERFRPARGNCGGGVPFDIFDIHPYTTGGPTHTGGANDVELGDLPKLRALLNAADKAGRIRGAFKHTPLWVGELSWDSNPPDPGGLKMKIETRWVAEALYRSWKAGVRVFFWFTLRDRSRQPGVPFSETLESGLYFRAPDPAQDQPKEVLYAFRFPFVAYPIRKGLSFWGRTPGSRPGKVAIQVRRGRGWRRVLTARADGSGLFRGLARVRYGQSKQGSVRAVYRGHASRPFSMKPVPDFRQPPFG
jgi:hypothetical protein